MGKKTVKSTEGQALRLDGQATVAEAEEIARKFRSILDSGPPRVILDLDGITYVDVSFLQLLLAFELSLSRKGRSLKIMTLPDTHVINQTAELLGIRLGHFFAQMEERV